MKFEQKRNDFIKIRDHGFKEPDIDKEKDYFFLGATKLPDTIINPFGQWVDFLPEEELQKKRIETYGCTGFGTLNANEILHLFQYKEEINWSDRCINILANNTYGGNNPHKPCESLRKKGCCLEKDLPYTFDIRSWKEFHSPKPLTQELLTKCSETLEKYEFGHEWISTTPQRLIEALKRSPVGISVLAWKYRNGMYFKESGERDNHWCVLVGYEYGKCWYVFDTYDQFVKKLEWDYNFKYAKRYYLKKKVTEEEPNIPQGDHMLQTYQFETNAKIFIKDYTKKNAGVWICDPINKKSYKAYQNMIKVGWITPESIKLEVSLYAGYDIADWVINTDQNPEVYIPTPFGEGIKKGIKSWFKKLFN